jgi:beta-glucosidase
MRVLRGFEEVVLKPKETKTVEFSLTFRDLATWSEGAENWVLRESEKTVFVGASSRDLRLNGTLAMLTN